MIDVPKNSVQDVKLLTNTIDKAKQYGLKRPTFILDHGFLKQENIGSPVFLLQFFRIFNSLNFCTINCEHTSLFWSHKL